MEAKRRGALPTACSRTAMNAVGRLAAAATDSQLAQASVHADAAEPSQSQGDAPALAHGCSAAKAPASGAPIASVMHNTMSRSRLSTRGDASTGKSSG
jgi:hypothetical protein